MRAGAFVGKPGPILSMTDLPGHLSDRRSCTLNGREATVAASAGAFEAEAIIAVALHNQACQVRECLCSITAQIDLPLRVATLVLDDNSQDEWAKELVEFAPHAGVVVAQTQCGSAARARNWLLDFSDRAFPRAKWVARLDADDRFAEPFSLGAALRKAIATDAMFILGGNRLRRSGELLHRSNPATPELLRPDYVLARLAGMARGEPEAELPSCNLLLATRAGLRYPDQTSAEDHWLVAKLLLCHAERGDVLVEPFYADYELDGAATSLNHMQGRHSSARKALSRAAPDWVSKEIPTA